MTDFVISEDDMLWWESGKPFSKYERKMMCDKIRSHPLSAELESAYKNGFNDGQAEGLPCDHCDFNERDMQMAEAIMKAKKAERERINDKLDYIRHTESKDEFFVTVYLFEVRKIVRGEP